MAIYFLTPDAVKPRGGVGIIYEMVELLNDSGFEAFVLHEKSGFVYPFTEASPRIKYSAFTPVTDDDLVVIPEVFGRKLHMLLPDSKYVILNQNTHLTFRGWGFPDPENPSTNNPYNDSRCLGVICVSDRNIASITELKLNCPLYRINYQSLVGNTVPLSERTLSIAFMPRKNSNDAELVLNRLHFVNKLEKVTLTPIHNMSKRDVISTLANSSIFLSFAEREGFSLPILEAMAQGCLVVGYDGDGGAEVLTRETGFPIHYGDIDDYSRCLQMIIETWGVDIRVFESKCEAAKNLLKERHSPEIWRKSVLETWNSIQTTFLQGERRQPSITDRKPAFLAYDSRGERISKLKLEIEELKKNAKQEKD